MEKQDEKIESINEADRNAFEIAKLHKKIALKEAEKAIAQNESAELAFKYLVLQLYMKYKLDLQSDVLCEDGSIKRAVLDQKEVQQ